MIDVELVTRKLVLIAADLEPVRELADQLARPSWQTPRASSSPSATSKG